MSEHVPKLSRTSIALQSPCSIAPSLLPLPEHHLRCPTRRRGCRVPLILGLDARAALELDVVVEDEVREHSLELVGGEEAGTMSMGAMRAQAEIG